MKKITIANVFCFFGLHDWKYQEAEYSSEQEELLGIASKERSRTCQRTCCNLKQIEVKDVAGLDPPRYYTMWVTERPIPEEFSKSFDELEDTVKEMKADALVLKGFINPVDITISPGGDTVVLRTSEIILTLHNHDQDENNIEVKSRKGPTNLDCWMTAEVMDDLTLVMQLAKQHIK